MGNYLTCVSCIEREQDEKFVKPLDLPEAEEDSSLAVSRCDSAQVTCAGTPNRDRIYAWDARDPMHGSPEILRIIAASAVTHGSTSPPTSEDQAQACAESVAPSTSEKESEARSVAAANELQAQINAIVNARAARRNKFPSPRDTSNAIVQAQINAIVNSHSADHCSYSPTAWPSHSAEQWTNGAEYCKQSPTAAASKSELQDQINAIVGVHASSLRQQRRELDPSEFASPSPAKSLSPEELGYFANLALQQAKERNTPAASPAPAYNYWTACEEDLAPCQLNFGEVAPSHASFSGNDSLEVQQAPVFPDEQSCATFVNGDVADTNTKPKPSLPRIEPPKEESGDSKKVEARPFNVTEIPSPTRRASLAKKRQDLLWANMTDEDPASQSAVDEAPQKAVEDEAQQKAAEEAARRREEEEAAARLREMDGKWLKEIEEKAELDAMDKLCVEAFLESVKRCAWREKVRTPIKGSNLYTKHMRPCRPAGTSVDVKDSTFRNLGNFLNFLEFEGLLCLQPGLTDPVVTQIHFDACRRYQYDPMRRPLSIAPHEPGCCCRLCLPCATNAAAWQ